LIPLNEHQFYSRAACKRRNFTSEVKHYGYLAIQLHYMGFMVLSAPCCGFDGCVDEGESLSELHSVTHF
jgi:hypothetical protein